MNITRQQLHNLVDMVEEIGRDTLYNVMIRFVPGDEAMPDEIISHSVAVKEYQIGEYVQHEDIDWN